jgi:DNA-binding ferritin-like protein
VREKARLLRLSALAESSHQLAIQQLTWIRDTLIKHNDGDLQELAITARDIVNNARRAVKDAREALDHHTAAHGC